MSVKHGFSNVPVTKDEVSYMLCTRLLIREYGKMSKYAYCHMTVRPRSLECIKGFIYSCIDCHVTITCLCS